MMLGALKLNTQTDTSFSTTRFKGLHGYIDSIIDECLPLHLHHYHVVLDQYNKALGKWARRAIMASGEPVLYAKRNGASELLPKEALMLGPYQDPYVIDNTGLFVRLDKLPYRYDHSGAENGGFEKSSRFLKPYERLKVRLAMDTEQAGFSFSEGGDRLRQILQDPSIIMGARISVFPGDNSVWKQVVHYAMKERGWWDPAFEGLTYSSGDNCIESYPDGFDYALLVPVIREFGGWLDFDPGKREQPPKASITCNLTTSGKDENGTKAIVKYALLNNRDNMLLSQTRFMELVYDAFGVDMYAKIQTEDKN